MATPASNVMMVRMTEHLRDRDVRGLLPIWHDTTRKLGLMFFPFVALLVVNAYGLITLLFTKRYVASVPIFMVWCLSILMAAFQTDGVLRVFAEMKYLFKVNLIRLLLMVATMGWFLSTFGLMGAVLITLVGILLAKIMAVVRIRKALQTTYGNVLPWKDLGSSLAVAIVSAVPAIVINAKLAGPSLVVLPISGMTYVVTYVVLVMTLGLLSESEKAAIRRGLYVWNRGSVESQREAGDAGGSSLDVRRDGAPGTQRCGILRRIGRRVRNEAA